MGDDSISVETFAVGAFWRSYTVSEDATTVAITTDTCALVFREVCRLSLYPIAVAAQVREYDFDKEIDAFQEYALESCVLEATDPARRGFSPDGCMVRVGPWWNCVCLCVGTPAMLHGFRGFYFSGDQLELSLICREFAVEFSNEGA